MQYFFLTSEINFLITCDKNIELKVPSSDSSYLCSSFHVQTPEKRPGLLSGLPNAAKPVAAVVVKLAVSLLEILISVFPLTFFFVY